MSFMISDLDLELYVVTDVRILPHEEFYTDWELCSSNLIMQLVLYIFCEGHCLGELRSAKFSYRV